MFSEIKARLLADSWAYIVFALYVSALLIFSKYVGIDQSPIRGFYLSHWLKVPFIVFSAFLTWAAVTSLRHQQPFENFITNLKKFITPRAIAGLALYFMLGLFHGSFTFAKSLLGEFGPFAWDHSFIHIDALIHGGDAWKLIPHHEIWTRFLQWVYLPVWLFALAGITFFVCLFSEEDVRRQYLVTFFFCWIVLGNLVAGLFFSAGPIYVEALFGSKRFEPLVQYLEFSRGEIFSSVDVADRLWLHQTSGEILQRTGISAFPSLHVAMATLFALVLARIGPLVMWLAVAFAVLIQIGSVHLAWHYAIDGYFSVLCTLLVWKLAGRIGVASQTPASRRPRAQG